MLSLALWFLGFYVIGDRISALRAEIGPGGFAKSRRRPSGHQTQGQSPDASCVRSNVGSILHGPLRGSASRRRSPAHRAAKHERSDGRGGRTTGGGGWAV
jgi:hypothetical protein